MKRIKDGLTKAIALTTVLLFMGAIAAFGQKPSATPAATPADKRGLGIQSAGSANGSQSESQAREAKPELVLQTGYNNFFGATRLVFSPDGRLLATATFRSSTIKLWETATGRELRNLSSGRQSAIGMSPFIAFSGDSRLVAAAAGENSVKVWDVTSGREVQTLTSGEGGLASSLVGVYFIAFNSNDQIVTISDAVRVWDIPTGKELRTIGTNALNGLAFMGSEGGAALSLDGTQLARVSTDGETQVKFLDLATGRETRSVKLPEEEIESAALPFTRDGHLLVSGIVDKRVKLWDVTNKANERDLGSTAQDWSLLKFSRDGRLLAMTENYTVKLWDLATGSELTALKAPNSGLFSTQGRVFVSFTNDGKKVATGGFDTPTILWETDSAKQLLNMSGRTNMAYKVAFSADGNQLSSGGRTRWDLRTGRGVRLTAGPSDKQFGFPSPDGRLLALFAPKSNAVSILETSSGRKLQTLAPATGETVVQRVSFSPDGTMLVVTYMASEAQMRKPRTLGQFGSNENQVKIWEVKSGRELHTLALASAPGEAGFSADGRVLATLGSMGEISLWDTAAGSRLRDLTSSPMANLSQMMNGIDPAQLKNMKPGKSGSMPQMPDMTAIAGMMTNMMGSMSAGTMGRSVTSLAFSPDGRTLAIGGVESKSNFDLAAMMNPAVAQKNQKKNSKPPDPEEMLKNMKVEAVGQEPTG